MLQSCERHLRFGTRCSILHGSRPFICFLELSATISQSIFIFKAFFMSNDVLQKKAFDTFDHHIILHRLKTVFYKGFALISQVEDFL